MSVLGDFYRLEAGELKPVLESSTDVQLKVADSWLVEDGRVRSLTAHFERFANWVIQEDPEQKQHLDGFCLLYTSPSPRDGATSRMPSSA